MNAHADFVTFQRKFEVSEKNLQYNLLFSTITKKLKHETAHLRGNCFQRSFSNLEQGRDQPQLTEDLFPLNSSHVKKNPLGEVTSH